MRDHLPERSNSIVGIFEGGWRIQLLFVALTLLMCPGPWLHPGDFPMSPPFGDVAQTAWNFWWVDRVISGEAGETASLFFCPILFYPLGAHLGYHTLELSYAVLLWPLRLLAGGVVQQNAALIAATWLTAWASWLAARQAGAAPLGAALASIAITLHPYRFGEAFHLNIFSTFFFPLTLFWFLRLRLRPDDRRAAIGLGLTALFALLTSLFHALSCAMAGLFLAIWIGWENRRESERLRRFLAGILLAVIIALPVLAWLAYHYSQAPEPAAFGRTEQAEKAAGIWQYLIHPRIRLALTGVEFDYYEIESSGMSRLWQWYLPGYLLTAAALALLWERIRRRTRNPAVLPLVIAGIIFALLSLGPWLKIGSPADANPAPSAFPLPGWLLAYVPGLQSLRSVWHFGFLGTSCFAILGGMKGGEWLRHLTRNLPQRSQMLIFVLAGLVIALDNSSGSVRSIPYEEDPLTAYLRESPRSGAVICLPDDLHMIRGHFMYQQTRHERPIFGGYLSRDPLAYEEWKSARKWPEELEQVGYGRIERISPEAERLLREDIAEWNIAFFMVFDNTRQHRIRDRVARELKRLGLGVPRQVEEYGAVIEIKDLP